MTDFAPLVRVRVSGSAVRVRDHAGHCLVSAGSDGHAERLEHELGAHVLGHRVAPELVGEFANGGAEFQAKGHPERALVHDFPIRHAQGRAGGSNGYRVRMWEPSSPNSPPTPDLEITVCHYPRGPSKWNKAA